MATQIHAVSAASQFRACIRIVLYEPNSVLRLRLRSVIDHDPTLSVVAEPRSWRECEKSLEDSVPELLVAREEIIPEAWHQKHSHTVLPLTIDLSGEAGRGIHLLPDPQDMLPHPDIVKRLLDQAIKKVYECKVAELWWMMDRYVEGLLGKPEFVSALKVKSDGGRFIELNVESIISIVAALKYVTINSTRGRYLLRKPIHHLASQLDPSVFMRIHRSVIINCRHLDHTKSMNEQLPHAVLLDGSSYPVGPHYRQAFSTLQSVTGV